MKNKMIVSGKAEYGALLGKDFLSIILKKGINNKSLFFF